MVDNLSNLEDFLSSFINKNVLITQDGFLKCQFPIENFAHSIEYEILNVFDNNGNNYLSMNLNQVYRFDALDEVLKFYLDNDTIIILSLNK